MAAIFCHNSIFICKGQINATVIFWFVLEWQTLPATVNKTRTARFPSFAEAQIQYLKFLSSDNVAVLIPRELLW